MKAIKIASKFVSGIGKVRFYGLFRNNILESYETNKKNVRIPAESFNNNVDWKEVDVEKTPAYVQFMYRNAG